MGECKGVGLRRSEWMKCLAGAEVRRRWFCGVLGESPPGPAILKHESSGCGRRQPTFAMVSLAPVTRIRLFQLERA